MTVIPQQVTVGQVLRRNKRKCSPARRVTFFLPRIILLRGRCYDRNGIGGSQAWSLGKARILFLAALTHFPPYKKCVRVRLATQALVLKKIHFLDNDRTSVL